MRCESVSTCATIAQASGQSRLQTVLRTSIMCREGYHSPSETRRHARVRAMPQPLVIVLAAGLGTRMKSDVAKVLHRVAGRPLVAWPIELARSLEAKKIVVVLGHQLETVKAAIDARFP